MKLALVLIIFSASLWARPIVLLGYFDPFGKAPFNNSEVVAHELDKKFKNHPDLDLRLCKMNTVFDKSFFQLEDCLKNLEKEPELVLGLGESNCNLKIETLGRNLDKTKGPDNDGIERDSTEIIPQGPYAMGFTYPLPQMYCSLEKEARKQLEVSNNAGSFVCNNLAYQFSSNYPELSFGFIHVPANNCRNLEAKTKNAIESLEQMILATIKLPSEGRLATTKEELEKLRDESKPNKCLNEFYKRTKGIDEKGLWPF